nr:zinc finger protein 692 [Misgurnus anguillicaudatus]
MSSSKSTLQSQRRRELDARRSKSRIRLGSCLQNWVQLKEELGFSLHSELAQHLLESYLSRICMKCSGNKKTDVTRRLLTTVESLQELILLVHNHGQKCPLPPVLQPSSGHETERRVVESESKNSNHSSEVDICLKYTCDNSHHFLWFPAEKQSEKKEIKSKKEGDSNSGDVTPASPKRLRPRGRKQLMEPVIVRQKMVTQVTTSQRQGVTLNELEEKLEKIKAGSEICRDDKNAGVTVTETAQDAVPQEGSDVTDVFLFPEPNDDDDDAAVLNLTKRGTQRRADATNDIKIKAGALKNNSLQSFKDDMSQISGRKKRKITQKVILPCEFEGCDKIFSSRQYLNHHVKYQHLQQKTFSCSHPTCNKSFNFKKHLKEHEKLHSNQRDYICEFCARAFRTSSNLIIHRRIHTGEKPLQCEVCGFTCRQKASLNWHMRKHNAESTYQFPCEICGRRFEKRDNVTAHRSKSHPDHNTPNLETCLSRSSSDAVAIDQSTLV